MMMSMPENKDITPRTRETPQILLHADPSAVKAAEDRSGQDAQAQLKEEPGAISGESDPPIVVRDGRTDHKAKGRADVHRGQSTHAGERKAPRKSVSSTLSALNRKAVEDRKHRFRNLYGLLDLQMLYTSFHSLNRNAAPGVDGVMWEDYGKNLDENLRALLDRLKGKRYRAQPVRRHYIPKGDKKRPLGIPSLEDKILQHAASQILESIYEADFSKQSVGYRRGQPGARESSLRLARELDSGTYRWVVEADIRAFFDEVDHNWLGRMLEQRINDRAFIGLIRKWLKAGVLEAGADELEVPEAGTPQGGIISPVLANIYLHFVLDLWIEKVVKKHCAGEVMFMRYADDIIVGFEYKRDADRYLRVLSKRLKRFSLRLAEEKSSLVKFNRWEPDDSGKFTFLGFDFYWARTRKNPNHKMVRRRTNKKKYRGALKAMTEWIKEARNWPLKMILSSLRRRLRGYWNYYCVIANSHMNWRYYSSVKQLVFKWLNRRSQRKSYTWERFKNLWLNHWDLPAPRIVESRENHSRGKVAYPTTELF